MPVDPVSTNGISKKKLDTVNSGWSIVYIEGSQVIISPKKFPFFSLMIDFVLANSADPDEMVHEAAFHLDLHCLPKYPSGGFWSTKGYFCMHAFALCAFYFFNKHFQNIIQEYYQSFKQIGSRSGLTFFQA